MNKNLLFVAFAIAFSLISFNAYINSAPSRKEERIYKEIKKYSPYYFEKRFGGLEILSKEDKNFKVKPSNKDVFKIMDKLERDWGKKHLKIINDRLSILDNNGNIKGEIKLLNQKEITFIRNFYGI